VVRAVALDEHDGLAGRDEVPFNGGSELGAEVGDGSRDHALRGIPSAAWVKVGWTSGHADLVCDTELPNGSLSSSTRSGGKNSPEGPTSFSTRSWSSAMVSPLIFFCRSM